MLVVDTHALIWIFLGAPKISPKVRQVVEEAQKNHILLMSAVVLWEVAMLIQKKRLSVLTPLRAFLDNIATLPGLMTVPLTPEIAAESVSLPGELHRDPFDRIIVATARCVNGTLLTRDSAILQWAKQGYLKTLKI